MAHYALLDTDSVVMNVIVGRDEGDLPDGIVSWEEHYAEVTGYACKRTSYNTSENQHLNGGTPFRGNYAGIGYRYDTDLDAFIPPQPFPSWTLDEATFQWAAPVAYPDDGLLYNWDEALQSWQEVTDGL